MEQEDMKALLIIKDVFHGEWNSTIKPQEASLDGQVL
jgi:hypothetical protein